MWGTLNRHEQFQVKNVTVTVNMLDVVYFSDETWFQSDGYMNSQRHRIWSNEEPLTLHEKSLHPQKIGVCCALSHLLQDHS
jgi:hypothetical protein